MRAKIAGVGRAVPSRVLTNADLEQMVDTSDEWIVERTGIGQRRILNEGQTTSDLAVQAGLQACCSAGIAPSGLDAIIVATVTPDQWMPSTAVHVQHKIGAPPCAAFDLSAACAGFVYGLTVAESLVRAGTYRRVLLVGVDVLSRVLNWQDRGTCVLFGDGAGAVVITETDSDGPSGVLQTVLGSDGSQAQHLEIPAGGAAEPLTEVGLKQQRHTLRMNGRQVFSQAVRGMAAAGKQVLQREGLSVDDVNIVFAHQANMRILEGVSQRIGIPIDRFFNNIEKYGNTSAASIPLAISEANDAGRLHGGDLVLITALGAGVAWGAALLRW